MSKIVLTIADNKLAFAIARAAKDVAVQWGVMARLVADFIGEGTPEQREMRYKLLRQSDGYKGADARAQSAIRKAYQRMRDYANPNRVRKARGARPEGNKKAAAKAKVKAVKPVVKTIHVLPEWAKDMPPLLVQWCEDHPIAALAALRSAYDRDVETVKRAA